MERVGVWRRRWHIFFMRYIRSVVFNWNDKLMQELAMSNVTFSQVSRILSA